MKDWTPVYICTIFIIGAIKTEASNRELLFGITVCWAIQFIVDAIRAYLKDK